LRRTRRLGQGLAVFTAAAAVVAVAPTLASAQDAGSPGLAVSPTSGPVGSVTVATGAGFPPLTGGELGIVTSGATSVLYSPVRALGVSAVSYSTRALATFTTDRAGAFSVPVTVPSGWSGTVVLRAATASASGTASFLVTAPVETEPVSSSAPPPAGGYRSLTPVGTWSSLPSDAQAAAMVRRSSWEPRPQNAKANATVPSGLSLGQHGGVAPVWNDWLLPRVTGNFTGTTDEIVQWAAAKWGLPDEVLRAQMISESYWYQGLLDANGKPVAGKGFGDYTTDQSKCPPGYTAPCPLSFGVLQIKYATYHPGTFPHSRDSTAFNIDYLAAIMRGCYEGWESWLASYGGPNGTASNYAAGDLYGCLGRWYSGGWHTPDAESYISSVKQNLTDKAWLRSGF
jgi:autotransporter family porin